MQVRDSHMWLVTPVLSSTDLETSSGLDFFFFGQEIRHVWLSVLVMLVVIHDRSVCKLCCSYHLYPYWFFSCLLHNFLREYFIISIIMEIYVSNFSFLDFVLYIF